MINFYTKILDFELKHRHVPAEAFGVDLINQGDYISKHALVAGFILREI